MILRDVVRVTGLSTYTVRLITKKHSLGERVGRTREFSDKDIQVLQMLAHYHKHRTRIIKLYKTIKKYPGIDDLTLRKRTKLTNYQYNIALTELTFLCYLWEDTATDDNGKEKDVYYVKGEFFEEYLLKYCNEGLQGVI